MKEQDQNINFTIYEEFIRHPWILSLGLKYDRDSIIASNAILRLIKDLQNINDKYYAEHNRVLFTSIEGRTKEKNSFFRRLQKIVKQESSKVGISQETLTSFYSGINDIAGVRFSCPYYDELKPTIENNIRPKLISLGYATNLSNGLSDEDCIDLGDEYGYRAYNFFVKVPTKIDIFGRTELFICEIQGRTELQHIWAVKSHDLLYKPKEGLVIPKELYEDMKHVSDNLRGVDHFLCRIKNNIKKKEIK